MNSPEAILQTLSKLLEEFEASKTSPNTLIINPTLLLKLTNYLPAAVFSGKFVKFKGKFLKVITTEREGFVGLALSLDTVCLEESVN